MLVVGQQMYSSPFEPGITEQLYDSKLPTKRVPIWKCRATHIPHKKLFINISCSYKNLSEFSDSTFEAGHWNCRNGTLGLLKFFFFSFLVD